MTAVFVGVVLVRFLLPLLIPRYPLPAIIGCLVVDALDQSIFQAFGYDPPGYQSYDKAMDVFYLAIAYLSTLRNWTSNDAFRVSRFLYFYRLVGVVAFELTQTRALLLIFPNTFEYFFIAYEGVRSRWSTLRLHLTGWVVVAAGDLDLRQAAAGVLDPRRPARRHRHPGGLRLGVAAADRAHPRARRPSCGSWCGPAPRRRSGRCAWPPSPVPEEMDTEAPSGPPGTRPRPRVVRGHAARRSPGRAAVGDLRADPARRAVAVQPRAGSSGPAPSSWSTPRLVLAAARRDVGLGVAGGHLRGPGRGQRRARARGVRGCSARATSTSAARSSS